MRICATFIILITITTQTFSHPVIWKNGLAMMVQTDNDTTNVIVHKSLSPSWSLGVRYLDLKVINRPNVIGQSNWLIKRWNEKNSQGNIYLLSGASQEILHVGFQADWETQEVYTFFSANHYATDRSLTRLRGRLGFAPYVGNFNDIHTWLIAQIDDTIVNGQHSISAIPVVRLFKDNILVEFGTDFSSKTFVAAMLHI